MSALVVSQFASYAPSRFGTQRTGNRTRRTLHDAALSETVPMCTRGGTGDDLRRGSTTEPTITPLTAPNIHKTVNDARASVA